VSNVLSAEKRVAVATALVEGCSIATTARMTGVSRDTIGRLLIKLGEGCKRLHNKLVRGVEAGAVEMDELWTFVHKKERRVAPGEPEEWGDNYVYVAMPRHSKLVIAWAVGKRDQATTDAFMRDVRGRVRGIVDLSSDAFSRDAGRRHGLDLDDGAARRRGAHGRALRASPGRAGRPARGSGSSADEHGGMVASGAHASSHRAWARADQDARGKASEPTSQGGPEAVVSLGGQPGRAQRVNEHRPVAVLPLQAERGRAQRTALCTAITMQQEGATHFFSRLIQRMHHLFCVAVRTRNTARAR